MSDDLLTPDEVARILAKPRSFVMALARGGGIAFVKLGQRDRRFRPADVEAYIEAHRTYTPTDDTPETSRQRGGDDLSGPRSPKAVGRQRHRGLDARGQADPKGALRIVRTRGEGHAA